MVEDFYENQKLFPILPCISVLVMFSACQSTRMSESGIRLGDKTLEQFKTGETTEDWLIAVVGQPTSRTDLPEGVSVLRYSTTNASSGVLNMIMGKSLTLLQLSILLSAME